MPASLPGAFEDGLGRRRHIADPSGTGTLEVLCLRDELTAVPAFEFALRERASRLASFRHTYFGHVRSIDRLAVPGSGLAVVSEYTPGVRLSTLLSSAERRLDINASLHLIRQLVSATALLHEHERDIAHGAIGPERLVVTPNARLVLVEYVLGGALEQLRYSHDRYWTDLRIALPRSIGLARFDQRTDVTQVGVVALSLVLGRLLHEDEYPARIPEILASARAISARGGDEPIPPGLRTWLSRALQLDSRHAFSNACEASAEFDRVLDGDAEYGAEPAQTAEEPSPFEPRRERVVVAPASVEPQSAKVEPEPEINAVATDVVQEREPQAITPEREERRVEPEISFASNDLTEPGTSRLGGVSPKIIAAVAAVVVVLIAGTLGLRAHFSAAPAASAPPTGTVNITTNPAGAQVIIDGRPRGVAPISIPLNPGPHSLELRGSAGEPRTMTFNVTAGTVVAQYIDMPQLGTGTGQLQIRTEPAGAQVAVDDVPRGQSPVTVEGLSAGDHIVSVMSEVGAVKQHVTITAGATAAVVVPLVAEGAPVSGWIAVAAPAEVQLYENKKLLGTSQSDRIMVTAGKHQIEIVNDTLGYRATRVVQVPPGKVTPIKVDWPKGTMSLNAIPWADVWVDGEKVGETPIGNLSVPVGAHEVIFRHPDLGELRQAVSVTVNAPARLSVDMRKK